MVAKHLFQPLVTQWKRYFDTSFSHVFQNGFHVKQEFQDVPVLQLFC